MTTHEIRREYSERAKKMNQEDVDTRMYANEDDARPTLCLRNANFHPLITPTDKTNRSSMSPSSVPQITGLGK